METTVNRKGRVTQLSVIDKVKKNSCVVSFTGGYAKFFFEDKDIPDGLQLKDVVEVTFTINDDESI